MTLFLEDPPEVKASAAEASEVSRRDAEARLQELSTQASALSSRGARKTFWDIHELEILNLSRMETRRGSAWVKDFLP